MHNHLFAPDPWPAIIRPGNHPAYPLAKGPLSEFGEPIFRVSYTHEGVRKVMLIAAPHLLRARMNAQKLARESGWTQLQIGKWRGAQPLKPARWVTRTAFGEVIPSKSPA
jgi:hypothetical protein